MIYTIPLNNVKKTKKYNPKKWNKSSEVEPPVKTPLRVKIFHINDKKLSQPIYRLCGFYLKETNEFMFSQCDIWEHEQIGEVLFRPWED